MPIDMKKYRAREARKDARKRELRRLDRENGGLRARVEHLRNEFGMTLDDYEEMERRQSGKCAMCQRPPKDGKRLVIDHCHASRRVRALLCGACNVLLGMAKDSVVVLREAIAYLEKHRAVSIEPTTHVARICRRPRNR